MGREQDMKFLPQSNGVRSVNMKRKMSSKEKIKITVIIIAILLFSGFIFQKVDNFIDGERLKKKVNYTTVNDLRLDYRVKGEGKYTVVFDGALGATMEEWTPLINQLKSDNVRTFVYNRQGYGYSSSGSGRTIEEQAEDLKILLRKAGMSGPYILVGDGYGSLVLNNFANKFSESVAAVISIDPINEETIKTDNYRKSQSINKLRRGVEKIGSGFGLTTLMDKLNIDVNLKDYEDGLLEENRDEFLTLRTKSSYTTAVYNELNNLIEGKSSCQSEGMFSNIPYYLLTKNENDSLAALGDKDLTTVYVTTCEKDYLPLNDTENVLTAIRQTVKKLQDIEIRNKQKNNS